MKREGMRRRDGARGNKSYEARWNESERLRVGRNESETVSVF